MKPRRLIPLVLVLAAACGTSPTAATTRAPSRLHADETPPPPPPDSRGINGFGSGN